MKDAGKAVGINFTGKAEKTPFTPAGHALLEYSKEADGGSKHNDIQEALFKVSIVFLNLPKFHNLDSST